MNGAAGNESKNKRKLWRCDVCLVATFDDYDVALAHESICTGVDADVAPPVPFVHVPPRRPPTPPSPVPPSSKRAKSDDDENDGGRGSLLPPSPPQSSSSSSGPTPHLPSEVPLPPDDGAPLPSSSVSKSDIAPGKVGLATQPEDVPDNEDFSNWTFVRLRDRLYEMNVPIHRQWRKADLVKWLRDHHTKSSPSPPPPPPPSSGHVTAFAATTVAASAPSGDGDVEVGKRLHPPRPPAMASSAPPQTPLPQQHPFSWIVDIPHGEKLGLFLKMRVAGAEIIKVSPTSALRGKVDEGDVVMKINGKLVISIADFTASEDRARRLEIWKGGSIVGGSIDDVGTKDGDKTTGGANAAAASVGRSPITVVPPPSSSAGSLFAMREEMGGNNVAMIRPTTIALLPPSAPRSSTVNIAATTAATVRTKPTRATPGGKSRALQRALKLQVATYEQYRNSHPPPNIAVETQQPSHADDKSAVRKDASRAGIQARDGTSAQVLGEDDISQLTYKQLREKLYELNYPIRKGWLKKDLVRCLQNHRLANNVAPKSVPEAVGASLPEQVSSRADHRPQDSQMDDREAKVDVDEMTDGVHDERDEPPPALVGRKSTRSILLVSLPVLATVASLLVYMVPLDFPHVILAFLLLVTTVRVVMSIAKTNLGLERSAMTTTAPIPTLREFLSHPDGFHMSFAPAFFGFFAYFGALAAMEEETDGLVVPTFPTESRKGETGDSTTRTSATCYLLQSVSGASSGAMAAVMLAAGIQPRDAFEFASTFTWGMVADPPGCGGYVKGNNFEEAMRKFIENRCAKNRNISPPVVGGDGKGPDDPAVGTGMRLEEGLVPVAVSAFDLMRMRGTILIEGCMARAARSSAGFPGLFQPVAWRGGRDVGNSSDGVKSWLPDSLLIDGGIADGLGLNGLGALPPSDSKTKRVINLVVGDFGFNGPSGIRDMPAGVNAEYVVSIAIVGTPLCGPWAMKNGPRAFEAARKAVAAAMDKPMAKGTCDNHHVIRIDASEWLD